jgi:hypothetical protein
MKRSSYGIIALVLCLFSLLHSCVFAPTEIHKSDASKSNAVPLVSVSVDLPSNGDTIFVTSQERCNFKFNSSNELLKAKLSINYDTTLYVNPKSDYHIVTPIVINPTTSDQRYLVSLRSSVENNSLIYHFDNCNNGTYILHMLLNFRTGGNTVSDNLGREGEVSKQMIVIVNRAAL